MNKSEVLAILAFVSGVIGVVVNYVNGAAVDYSTLIPLALAIWSAFHASTAATPPSAPPAAK